MKEVLVLILLVLNECNGDNINFLNEQKNVTDDSFQVNVSAGYGVHSENSTVTTTSPNYQYEERRRSNESSFTNHHDQVVEPSRTIHEILPTPSYQVREINTEMEQKKFQRPNKHRYRSTEQRIRTNHNDFHKVVNDLQYKDINRYNQPKLGEETRIVEVLRVPAVYELHLQSDPQRLITLNPWVNKMSGFNQRHYKRPMQQPYYQVGGGKMMGYLPTPTHYNLIPSFGTFHAQSLNDALQDVKMKMFNQKSSGNTFNQLKTTLQPGNTFNQLKTTLQPGNTFNQLKATLQPISQNIVNYKHNLRNHLYQHESAKKPKQVDYQYFSNEITSDYYQKPQALHEVPAPVLNRQPHHKYLPKIKSTSVPNLVYGKPAKPTYQPTVKPSGQVPGLWNNKQQEPNHLYYNKEQILNSGLWDNKQQQEQNHQYYNNGQIIANQHQEYYPEEMNNYNLGQHYYNEAIGNYLDQSLVSVNGGVATYMDHDGTMTVSSLNQNPKLYPDYAQEVPSTKATKTEEAPEFTMPQYSQHIDLSNYGNQMYTGYNHEHEIPVTEPSKEESVDHNNNLNLLIDTGHGINSELSQEQKFDPIGIYDDAINSKRINYPRPFKINRRTEPEPMNYIVYINERTID